MNNRDYFIMVALISLSVMSSFFFTFYGINSMMTDQFVNENPTFAYITLAYGLGNLAVLSLAWSSREVWAVTAIQLFALCYFGVLIMDLILSGQSSLFYIGRIVLLSFILYLNRMAVKKVVERS